MMLRAFRRLGLSLCLCLFLVAGTRADHGFTHMTRSITTCVVGPAGTAPLIVSAASQRAIAMEWTYGHGVSAWDMSPWAEVADMGPDMSSPLAEGVSPATRFRRAHISYTTVLRLPKILAAVVDVHQELHVRKDLYAAGNKLFSFVTIKNVPMLGMIRIGTVMTFYGNRRLVSRHDVRYESFPWVLSWASDVLQREIVKSIERIDMLSGRHYCAQR
jgi:hypothetical protein